VRVIDGIAARIASCPSEQRGRWPLRWPVPDVDHDIAVTLVASAARIAESKQCVKLDGASSSSRGRQKQRFQR